MEASPAYSPSLLLLLIIFSTSSALLSPNGVNYEVQVLMTIKYQLKDPHGVLNNWDKDSVDPCSWTAVACSPDQIVIGLEAQSQDLSGRLSPSIGNLTNLESIQLQSNNLTGPIPAEVGKLAKLKKISLSHNHFYGEIPSSVSHLRSLQYLDLSYNNLGGPVPRLFAGGTLILVGNPLICGVNTGQDCSKSSPVPMSSNLKISQAALPTAETRSHKFVVALSSTIACIIFLSFPIS
ncbi:unnamed protein product [Urochloa decumbens]|uniref:Leucine-rich repeat-containing N-terminal plant-type domain-containing protein n=1 Tax=Urochloa decumbens TaxID=240449 RepID=A0ABC9DSM4_9POAL